MTTNDRREISMTEIKKDEFAEEHYGNLDFLTEEEVSVIAAQAFAAGVSEAVSLFLPIEDGFLALATEAYEKGDDAGFITGIAAGFEDGFAAGSDEGHAQGYADGYADSQRELHNAVGV